MNNEFRVYLTKRVQTLIENEPDFGVEIMKLFLRYGSKDWGEVTENEKAMNDRAVETKEQVLGIYHTSQGKINIITEEGHKITTVVFADEN